MILTPTTLFTKNGFQVSKITILGTTYFVAEKNEARRTLRYIRKSLKNLEKMVGK